MYLHIDSFRVSHENVILLPSIENTCRSPALHLPCQYIQTLKLHFLSVFGAFPYLVPYSLSALALHCPSDLSSFSHIPITLQTII